jgi:hypothetical protein
MLACIMLTEAGIEVCCPVHDALMIKAPIDRIAEVVEQAKHCMRQAALVALEGFPIEVDAKTYPHGTRYMDKRGGGDVEPGDAAAGWGGRSGGSRQGGLNGGCRI